jgi:hypothetical protein
MYRNLFLALYTLCLCGFARDVFGADELWKDAWVKKVVTGAELKAKTVRECVMQMSAEDVDAHRFAVLVYWKGRGWGYKTVPVPQQADVKPGDIVSFDFNHCDTPLRQLSPSPPHQ